MTENDGVAKRTQAHKRTDTSWSHLDVNATELTTADLRFEELLVVGLLLKAFPHTVPFAKESIGTNLYINVIDLSPY